MPFAETRGLNPVMPQLLAKASDRLRPLAWVGIIPQLGQAPQMHHGLPELRLPKPKKKKIHRRSLPVTLGPLDSDQPVDRSFEAQSRSPKRELSSLCRKVASIHQLLHRPSFLPAARPTDQNNPRRALLHILQRGNDLKGVGAGQLACVGTEGGC